MISTLSKKRKMGEENKRNKTTTAQNQNQGGENQKQKVETNKEIVLKVYIHCEGCSKKVVDSLRGFDGVEEIKVDRANSKVIVKGEKADPVKVFERLQKKYGRNIELISPKPAPGGEEKKEEKKKEPEPPIVKIMTLKMFIHCEGCARDIKKNVVRMEGVYTVEPDMGKSQVAVKGAFDPPKLVETITKRMGKHVEIVKVEPVLLKKDNNNKEIKKDKEIQKENEVKYVVYNPPPHLQNRYNCLIFSDENVNSCFIM